MINAEFTNEINDLITENLYQWDTYQTLRISGIDFGSVAPRVHFANKKSTEALVVDGAMQTDGSVEVSIPNSLLTQKYDILAYVYINTGLTSKTIKSITIPIISRLKPSEYYQPTDEDIAQIEAIELEAKAIISGLTASEYNATATYTRPNIVYYKGDAYMCNSKIEVTGILPTDTSVWQMICAGALVTNIDKDDDGNLVFVFENGTRYTVEIAVANANAVDGDDVPSLLLTAEDVKNVKNPPNPTKLVGTSVTGDSLTTSEITKTGLYITVYLNTNGYYTDILAIPDLTRDSYSNSGKVKYDSSTKKITVIDESTGLLKTLNFAFKLIPVDSDGKKLIYNLTSSDEYDY